MQHDMIATLHQTFEECAYEQDSLEYWFARDLQVLLEYQDWRNFLRVIEKAKTACVNSSQQIPDHFVGITKKVKLGSEAERDVDDIMLTRYACYLIAQNGDPAKERIAFAQSYFALQTRKQELLEERIALHERLQARQKLRETETELSKIIFERGVDQHGFGRIRSKGDQALFGGHSTQAMKKRLGVPDKRALADFLPTITIKAKDLATEITNFNVKKSDLMGESPITREHVKNNQDVRALLAKSDIVPEQLPPEEDIQKLERRVKSHEKQLAQSVTRKLPVEEED